MQDTYLTISKDVKMQVLRDFSWCHALKDPYLFTDTNITFLHTAAHLVLMETLFLSLSLSGTAVSLKLEQKGVACAQQRGNILKSEASSTLDLRLGECSMNFP